MAIIKLTPSCKDYLWGGSRLRTADRQRHSRQQQRQRSPRGQNR